MDGSIHPMPKGMMLRERLDQLGRWLVDAAGTGLGFRESQHDGVPPAIGAQAFSGGESRLRRRWLRRRYD
jgi:hypothetical protein